MNASALNYFIAVLVVLGVSLGACGNESDTPRDHCEDYCENQGTAVDCPNEVATDYVAECKQFCGVVLPQLDSECRATADEYFECSAAEETWKCAPGGSLPLSTNDICDAKADAYAECFANQ